MIEHASLRADLVDSFLSLVCVQRLLLSMTSVQWGRGGGGVGVGRGCFHLSITYSQSGYDLGIRDYGFQNVTVSTCLVH